MAGTDAPIPPPEGPRRYPSTIGGGLYLLVLLAVCVGLGIVLLGDWRVGVRWIGGALVLGAGFRVVVPASESGMLAVRHRLVDTAMLTTVGGTLVFLAGSIPNQPF